MKKLFDSQLLGNFTSWKILNNFAIVLLCKAYPVLEEKVGKCVSLKDILIFKLFLKCFEVSVYVTDH